MRLIDCLETSPSFDLCKGRGWAKATRYFPPPLHFLFGMSTASCYPLPTARRTSAAGSKLFGILSSTTSTRDTSVPPALSHRPQLPRARQQRRHLPHSLARPFHLCVRRPLDPRVRPLAGELRLALLGHMGGVWALAAMRDILVSSSTHCTVRIRSAR
jgi:hypothetical protein